MRPPDRWIYVTGAPRSATTFVGSVLAHPWRVDYIHEPFNPDCGMVGMEQPFPYLRLTEPADSPNAMRIARLFRYEFTLRTGYYPNDSTWRRAVKRVIGSRGPLYLRLAKLNVWRRAVVIKDPIGCLMTEYLAVRHGVRPVVIIRHPLAFVASILRLGWRNDLASLARQPDLVADYFSGEAGFLTQRRPDPIEAAAALWRALNKVLAAQIDRYPDWIHLTHEAMSARPVETFRDIHMRLGLPWTGALERLVRSRTASKNPAEGRSGRVQDFVRNSGALFALRAGGLTPKERQTVFDVTRDVAGRWYGEGTFGLAGAQALAGPRD